MRRIPMACPLKGLRREMPPGYPQGPPLDPYPPGMHQMPAQGVKPPTGKKRNRWPWVVMAAVLVLLIVAIAAGSGKRKTGTSSASHSTTDHSQHNKQYIKQLGHDDADNSAAINGSPGAGYYGSTVTRSL